MNLPNKLTVLRMIMIPFFVAALLMEGGQVQILRYLAAGIFIVASLTDMLDGKIARKYNLVTNFGKFMDPLADKLLVCSALICLVELRELPAWMVIVIISREFIISGFRLVASDNGGDCRQLLGKVQDHVSDDCRGTSDFKDRSPVHGNNGCGMDCPGSHGDFPGRLYCEECRST